MTPATQTQDAVEEALVIFTPSGKRGRFALGTPVLQAARALGVDLDSVCGGRGICSKCQISPGYGEFPKFGIHVDDEALTEWNAVEERYKSKRGMLDGRRLGCQAKVMGDVVIDVPPESQVHKQVIRKSATERVIAMDPATRALFIEVAEPDMHEPTGDFERVKRALADQWGVGEVTADLSILRRLPNACPQATAIGRPRKSQRPAPASVPRSMPNAPASCPLPRRSRRRCRPIRCISLT